MTGKYDFPRIYDTNGAPSFWAYMNAPQQTFPGDTGDVADLMRGTSAGVRSTTGCTWAKGTSGNCISLNGSNGLVTFGKVSTLLNNWTISARFRILGSVTTSGGVMVAYNGNDFGGYGIGLNGTGNFGLLFGGAAFLVSSVLAVTGVDYHVLATRISGTAYLYVNGVNIVIPGSTSTPGSLGVNNFYIGAESNQRYFQGLISDTRFWPRGMTSTCEIAREYADPDWRLRPPTRTRLFVMSHSLFRRNLYDRTGSRGVA